jgi:hypothetical protein
MDPYSVPKPGPVVLFGSGETSPSGRKVFDLALKKLPTSPRLALLETPAGFELNSAQVIGRVAEFIEQRLQNYQPRIAVVPARKRGSQFSTDDPALVSPLLEADLIFMGPGSPTYAIRQLQGSLAWHYLLARHQLGATMVFASAAVVAISTFALPVYEIYKVGTDIFWNKGLDFFGLYGLPLVLIPHWNNHDGGDELDTSRCFMGQSRFAELMQSLPANLAVVGIDEKTALMLDLQSGTCRVVGQGGVTIIHTGHEHRSSGPDLRGTGLDEVAEQRLGHIHLYRDGEKFPLQQCCPLELRSAVENLPPTAWKQALQVQECLAAERLTASRTPTQVSALEAVPAEVKRLLQQRQEARLRRDWLAADTFRSQIAALGWKVIDSPEGSQLVQVEIARSKGA